jgi:hypothetical protein
MLALKESAMTHLHAGLIVCVLFAFGCDKKDDASPAAPKGSQPAAAESGEREHRDRPFEHERDGGREHEREQK